MSVPTTGTNQRILILCWENNAIAWRDLIAELTRTAQRYFGKTRTTHSQRSPEAVGLAQPLPREPLRQLVLTDEVSRVLFAEYANHRQSSRSEEETGWALLGIRRGDEAIALATIPAGGERDAGDTHVRFNGMAQAFTAQVLRQSNKYLTMLGVVHTHPGSLRHPSDGDYRGDIQWVSQQRSGDGIFGIGTADGKTESGPIARHPQPNVQCLGELCYSWYSLQTGDRIYRPLRVEWTLGPDLALPLRPVWDELEAHAERLLRLAQQLKSVVFEVLPGRTKPCLVATITLPDPGRAIRVMMEGKVVRYLLIDPDGDRIADFCDDAVDRGVFVVLAELAGSHPQSNPER